MPVIPKTMTQLPAKRSYPEVTNEFELIDAIGELWLENLSLRGQLTEIDNYVEEITKDDK